MLLNNQKHPFGGAALTPFLVHNLHRQKNAHFTVVSSRL